MRDIKFRAWDGMSDEMLSMEEIEISGMNLFVLLATQSLIKVMQYTGLKDKNGKEIYEGDICTIWCGCKQDKPYVVEDMRELYSEMNRDDSYLRITSIEVIGNVYENSYLLEGKTP